MRRNANNLLGSFRFNAEYYRIDDEKVRIVDGITLPIEGEDDFFQDEPEAIVKWAYEDGKGLSKERAQLFDNWIIQTENRAIATPSTQTFNKGERIVINGEIKIIKSTFEKMILGKSRNLRGNKKEKVRRIQVLLLG